MPYYSTCKRTKPPDTCILDLHLEEDIKSPIYVYYQLDNLFQNHRRYVKSRSNTQLKGNKLPLTEVDSDCYPIITNKDLGGRKNLKGFPLPDDDPAFPCGLIAQSVFNDTFELIDPKTKKNFEINPKGIAWSTDVSDLFKNGPEDYESYQWMDVTDERFIVWMRVAGMKNFRKPWGIIHEKLPKGDYELHIQNNYPVTSFNGNKKFFLSTTNSYGGRNRFLAV